MEGGDPAPSPLPIFWRSTRPARHLPGSLGLRGARGPSAACATQVLSLDAVGADTAAKASGARSRGEQEGEGRRGCASGAAGCSAP
jgi:hypothetical protein